MKLSNQNQKSFALLCLAFSMAQAQNLLSIRSEIPKSAHSCISKCIFYPGVYKDLATALACGSPVENECYCATQTASASAASAWIDRCAREECSAGDISRDVTSMRGIYAGYCNNAGFKQPIVSEWLTGGGGAPQTETEDPAPGATKASQTEDTNAPETSRTVTIVTKTADPEPKDGGASRSTVILESTSIFWIIPENTEDPEAASRPASNNTMKLGLGVGLGVGLAVLLGAAALGTWLLMRKKKKNAQAHNAAVSYLPGDGSSYTPAEAPPQSVSPLSQIERKPIASTPSPLQSEKTELSAQHVTREVSGREIQPPPVATPSPVSAHPDRYEMWADTRSFNTAQQTSVVTEQNVADLGRSDPRYELARSDPRFCEEDYLVTRYIGEFINTLSSFAFVAYGIYGFSGGSGSRLGARELSYCGLMGVGMCSAAYHMTLKYHTQMSDELSMHLLTTPLIYRILTFKASPQRTRLIGLVLGTLFTVVMTVHMVMDEFLLHAVAFGLAVLTIVVRVTQLIPQQVPDPQVRQKLQTISRLGVFFFLFGYFVWLIDEWACGLLTNTRHSIGLPLGFLLELHGWWHIFTAIGGYIGVVTIDLIISGNVHEDPTGAFAWPVPLVARIASGEKGVVLDKKAQ